MASSELLHVTEQRVSVSLVCRAASQLESASNSFVATVHWASKPHKSLYALTAS